MWLHQLSPESEVLVSRVSIPKTTANCVSTKVATGAIARGWTARLAYVSLALLQEGR
jgi:hypothetical protein